jgi:hypothetical protein
MYFSSLKTYTNYKIHIEDAGGEVGRISGCTKDDVYTN